MPTRTIYLSDDQMKTYQKAQTIAGERNMSNYVIKALEYYMDAKHVETKEGFAPYILFVGETGEIEKVMFRGSFLSSVQRIEKMKHLEWHLYLTQKGHILLYDRCYDEQEKKEKAKYQVFETIEDLVKSKSNSVPKELIIKAKEKLNIKEAVQLDI